MGVTLRTAGRGVFFRCAVLRASEEADDAGGYERARGGRRERGAVGRGSDAVGPLEARREGPDALEADIEADLRDRAVGVAQQRGGALHPAGEQIGMRRLAERSPELAAEVRPREAGGACQVVHVE